MKIQPVTVLKRATLYLMVLLLSASRLSAQTDVTIGLNNNTNTNTTYPTPFGHYYNSQRAQYLYRASELTASGMNVGFINAIKFNVTALNGIGVMQGYTVRLSTTTVAALNATTWEAPGAVIFGPQNYQTTLGINQFNVVPPIFWNGTDNLLVEVCYGTTTAGYTNNAAVPRTSGLSFNGSHSYFADNMGSLCGTTTTASANMTIRPDIILNYTIATACAGTPVGGTAISSLSNVCAAESFVLSLTGASIASGLTYQWQSSTDNSTWTNIPGATAVALTTTQTVTNYYRCVVTCTASGATASSAAALVTSPLMIHGTFTINKNAPAGGGNFVSFNAAYDYIKCGIDGPVIFNVVAGSGPYNEQLIMIPVPGASAANTVTFNGNGETISYLSTNTNQRAVIKLNGADYITFTNLVINALGSTTAQYGFGVQLLNDADYNTVNNCTINVAYNIGNSTNYSGIVVSFSDTNPVGTGSTNCDNNTFSNNTITGGYYGITLVGSTTAANQNNKIINNKISEFYQRGVYALGTFNTLIQGNTFNRPTRTDVSDFSAVYLNSLNTMATINANRIMNPFGGALASASSFYGIFLDNVGTIPGLENKVTNNLVYNLNGSGNIIAVYVRGSNNVWIYHNTISLDAVSTVNSTTLRMAGYAQEGTSAGIQLVNNIITLTANANIARYCIYFSNQYSIDDVTSNKNDLYVNAPGTNAFTGYYNGNRAALNDWQTVSGQDANSFVTNPFYKDITIADYTTTSAVLNDRGTPVGVMTDINSVVRSATTPDIGAFEFTPETCITPPVPGNAQVNRTVVCQGNDVALSLAGNSMGLTQTYQWQTSPTATGTFTNLGNVLNYADTVIKASVTQYYRVALTCGVNTTYATPVLLTVNNALPAGTYTIDKTLPASATNFVSFNDAKLAMLCGIAGKVVFEVTAGRTTYEEQLILDSIPGTSAINTITFNGNGNTIHYSSAVSTERAVIKLRRADHITFDNLRIDATGTGTYGYGVQLYNRADSNTINGCEIIAKPNDVSDSYEGVVIVPSAEGVTGTDGTWCTGNTISNNKITGGYYGIVLAGNSASFMTNTRITGNTVLDYYVSGIRSRYSYSTLIEGNTINRPTRTNSNYDTYGIHLDNYNDRAKVARNSISNAATAMITTAYNYYGIGFTNVNVSDINEDTIVNNVIYNMNSYQSRYGIYAYFGAALLITHNTVSVDAVGASSGYNSAGLYIYYNANTKVSNNNVTVTSTGAGTKYAIYTYAGSVTSSNNNFYVKAGGTANYIGYNGTNQPTLADWQGATGQDAASTNYDPIYADLPGGNLTPAFYKMDNTGIPQGITNDILNKTRSTTIPDVGAYEVSIPLCQTPINAGKTVVVPNGGICMGTTVLLDLDENTTAGRLTYQWQASYSVNGPWITISDTMYVPNFKTELGANNYFRCQVVCSGTDTAYSVPAAVNMNAPLIKGVYTINPAGTGTRNFPSFRAAVAAMECGIAGEVIFDVVPGTYTEQVRMHKIAGASDTSRVTFRSQDGNPASVTLTYTGTAADNYVLKLDSASYITYKNITIIAASTTNGRAVVFAGNAVKDSLLTNSIKVPGVTVDNNDVVGVYAEGFKGNNISIVGNTITNGARGIHFAGTSVTDEVAGLLIDSNKVSGVYGRGISVRYANRVVISKNVVDLQGPLTTGSAYGIILANGDTAYTVKGNTVTISNTTGSVWGITMQDCNGTTDAPGLIDGNKVIAVNNNSGMYWGLANSNAPFNTTVNNVISIHTTGAVAYGLYSLLGGNINYYNNSVYNSSPAVAGMAGYFSHTTAATGNVRLRNNIFSNEGGGYAIEVANPLFINSDYNTYYTTGNTLIRRTVTATNYGNLTAWITATDLDISSIVYKPAFASTSTLAPDLTNPDVWAIHGRGVQVAGNNYDINQQYRPVTLTEGVPDMGAYEFLPTVAPTVLQAIPAVPAPGTTQIFYYGSDTVAKISWSPASAVPAAITLQRYSGVVPPNLATGTQHMYFYTDVDVTGGSDYKFDLQQYYVDSWLGFIDKESNIRLGRTDVANSWLVNDSSTVNTVNNIIADTALQYLDKFTGLRGRLIGAPPLPAPADSSNSGTRFWVGYGHDRSYLVDNAQNLALYLIAQQEAHVVVKVNGTTWTRSYTVPANSAITTDLIPKTGLSDARLMNEGLFPYGISIESDAPITAYAHQYSANTSGATLLLPVGTYGYEYRAFTARQYADTRSFSWFYVVADNDSTEVEITPAQPTVGGHAAGVPFIVKLNKGDVYQVLGKLKSGNEGYDLTGSHIKSIQGASGKCYPIGVFSGNSFSSFGCGESTGSVGTVGDNTVQQNMPVQSWGTKYLTAPSSAMADPIQLMRNIYRVVVNDPATVVSVNNVPLTGLINDSYYQFESKTADYITADKPVAVAQYFTISGACSNPTGGDVDMVYLAPLEQGTKKAAFYRNAQANVTYNLITVVIPTQGLATLLIDGSNVFNYTYNHPNKPGYTVVVKRWNAGNAVSNIQSDSAFTGITYGFGANVSYAYNVGMQIRNLNIQPSFTNTYNTSGNKDTYTCVGTPFYLSALLPVRPATLTWKMSEVANVVPAADIVETVPMPAETVEIDGRMYYRFILNTNCMFTTPGIYQIPVKMTHPDIASCDNSITTYLKVKVIGAPLVDFAVSYSGCISDVAIFNGTASTENNTAITKWEWKFGDGTTADTRNVTKQYTAAGTYIEELHVVANDGCIGDTSKTIVVHEPTAAILTADTLTICANTDATFTIQNVETDAVYNWYNASTGGALLSTGTSFEIRNAVSPAVYYVEIIRGDCAGLARTPATLLVLPQLVTPVLKVDTIGVDIIRFSWNEIAGATGYLVSADNGTTWITPSSGPLGLEHTIRGLKPQQTVTLLVKATGCEEKVSDPATGKTLPDGVYIPTGFSPNGDGLNDIWLVYGAIVREIHFQVFNQWGEKIFESNNQQTGWDGTYKGKAQPSGVYIYICKLKLADGTLVDRKGTINLLR